MTFLNQLNFSTVTDWKITFYNSQVALNGLPQTLNVNSEVLGGENIIMTKQTKYTKLFSFS